MPVRSSGSEKASRITPLYLLRHGRHVRHYGTKPVNIVWKLKEALAARIVSQAEKAL